MPQTKVLTEGLLECVTESQGLRNFVYALFTSNASNDRKKRAAEEQLQSNPLLLERLEAAAPAMLFMLERALYGAFNGRALRPDIQRWQVVNWAIMEMAHFWEHRLGLCHGELEPYSQTMESLWLALCGKDHKEAKFSRQFLGQMASSLLEVADVHHYSGQLPQNNITLRQEEYHEALKAFTSED